MSNTAPNKKKLTKIILWCALAVVLLLVLIPLVSLLVQKFITKEKVPSFLGYSYMIVITPSMTGYANVGDLVIVKKTDDYVVHDVVAYFENEDDELPITHRVVDYDEVTKLYTTKGDANMDEDKPITEAQIIGEVVAVIPYVGLFFEWFTNEGGVIYVVAMIAVIVACVYFWDLTKPAKKATEGGSADSDEQANTDIADTNAEVNADSTADTNAEASEDNKAGDQQSPSEK